MPCSAVDQYHSFREDGGSGLLYGIGTHLPERMASSHTRWPCLKVCAQESATQPFHEPMPSCWTWSSVFVTSSVCVMVSQEVLLYEVSIYISFLQCMLHTHFILPCWLNSHSYVRWRVQTMRLLIAQISPILPSLRPMFIQTFPLATSN